VNNRAGEMDVFVQAVRSGSFSAAGRRLGLSPSAVSKVVSRIEDRLGTRLLVRSTRSLKLTAEGEAYHGRALRILADIEETERMVAHGADAAPRGRLRVSASIPFAVQRVLPRVPDFLARYPAVDLDLSLSDDVVDLIEDRTDVAVRAGPLRDSGLKARKLCETRHVVVASPAWIARHGNPGRPDELDALNCLGFNIRRSLNEWPFREPGTQTIRSLAVSGNFETNNGETVRQMALAGLGAARLARYHVEPDIAAGRLRPILEEWNPGDTQFVHAVFVGHAHLAARIRAFVDFLADQGPVNRPLTSP